MHVYLESFVMSSISGEQELRGDAACDTCCNRTVAGQEWEIEVLDAAFKNVSSLEQVIP